MSLDPPDTRYAPIALTRSIQATTHKKVRFCKRAPSAKTLLAIKAMEVDRHSECRQKMGSVLHFLPKNAISSRFIDPMKLDSFLAGWVGTGWWWVQRPNSHYFKICLICCYNNRQSEPRATRPQSATDLDQPLVLADVRPLLHVWDLTHRTLRVNEPVNLTRWHKGIRGCRARIFTHSCRWQQAPP